MLMFFYLSYFNEKKDFNRVLISTQKTVTNYDDASYYTFLPDENYKHSNLNFFNLKKNP
jgi:hypothetical protein